MAHESIWPLVSIVTLYWNLATFIHLCIIYDCFHEAIPEGQRLYGPQSESIYSVAF